MNNKEFLAIFGEGNRPKKNAENNRFKTLIARNSTHL